jgi:hypothetical protein
MGGGHGLIGEEGEGERGGEGGGAVGGATRGRHGGCRRGAQTVGAPTVSLLCVLMCCS